MTLAGHTRDLDWDGCVNVRDLGGVPTEDGARTRPGAIVRGGSPRRLTIHCAGGKDRTGLLVALLLRLAGVQVEEICDDYAASEAVGPAPRAAMRAVLDELERHYGDVDRYLRDAGLDPARIESLRRRLLEGV